MTTDSDAVYLVVEAIAEADGVGVQELDYALHEHVYTESIRRLVEAEYTGWELSFEVPDHEVHLRAGDGVYVDGERRREFPDGIAAAESEDER